MPGPFTMAQQAQIDYYGGSRELAAMDYAAAVNDEIRDLFAAGADVVQIDEPYMQARPEEARAFGLSALNRALEGVAGHHRGAHLLRLRGHHSRAPVGLFIPAGARRVPLSQVSIETAQSSLDCAVLKSLPGKKIILGVIDLANHAVETPELVASRIRRALPFVDPGRSAGRTGLRHEVPAPRRRLRQAQAMVAGAQLVRRELEAAAGAGVNS